MNPLRTRRAARLTRTALVASSVAALTVTATVTTATAQDRQPRPSVALDWYDTTAAGIAAAGAPTQITNSRTWAISWLAAARATRTVPHGVDRADFQDAALASAVHDSLSALIPARTRQFDAALATTLDRIQDGPVAVREQGAQPEAHPLVLAHRDLDDGLSADRQLLGL
ncbi:hypothetical protein ACWCQG_36620, partial [Streptomyces sp. NPDC002343]